MYDFCLKTKQDFAAIILCSVLNFSVGCVVFSASKNKSENHWRGDGRRTWIITSSEQTRTSERNEALRRLRLDFPTNNKYSDIISHIDF